jgi:hypothetical protein
MILRNHIKVFAPSTKEVRRIFATQPPSIMSAICLTTILAGNIGRVRKSIATEILIGKTESEVKELVNRYSSRFNVKPEECLLQRIARTPEQIAEKLGRYVDLGADLVIGHFVDSRNLKSLELFWKMSSQRSSKLAYDS